MAPFFLFQEFIDYLQIERRYSVHTIVAYKKDLEQFCESLGLGTVDDIKEVNHRSVRSWIQELNEAGQSNKTINRKLSSLRSWYKWLRKQKVVETSPLQKIKGPKVEKRLPSFVKAGHMDMDDKHFTGTDFEIARDKLMIEFFYQTGIRLAELIQLKDVDVHPSHIKVLGKRNKERLIPISKELFAMAMNYQNLKNQLSRKSNSFFVIKNGEILYPKLVYRKINSYLGKVTIMDKKSPHVLRHTFATHMLNNGAGIETLKEILGHSNLSATQIYTHNSFTQISNIYSQAHPRGHKTN